MNYKLIKEVIINLKNKIKCDKCHKSFINSELNIYKLEEDAVYVSCHCQRCHTDTMVDISITQYQKDGQGEDRTHQNLQATVNKHSNISQDDVLDFKNFIKDFSGDFKNLFKKR